MDKPEASPCPFCSSTNVKPAEVIVDDSSVNDFLVVCCFDCGARGPKEECWQSATDAWNRRAVTPQTKETV